MKTTRLLSVLAVAGVMTFSGLAYADTPAETEATARFEEGNKLWQLGKHEEARIKFVQAYSVLKAAGVVHNLALAEMTVGHTEEAYRLFRDFLKLPQTDMNRSLQARKYFADLGKKVSLITVSEKTPKGTKIIVDGVEAGDAPLADPIVVKPGKHDVVLKYGADEKKEPESCPVGGTVTVELLPKGETNGSLGPVTPPPLTKENGNWVPTIVLGVAGVAGLGIGAVMGALSASQDDELRSLSTTTRCTPGSPGCAQLEDKASAASGLGVGSVVGYVGGGLFLGAAIVTAAVMKPWQMRVREARVQFVPGLGGAAVVGTF